MVKEKKKNLRKDIIAKRNKLSQTEISEKSKIIYEKFFSLEKVKKAQKFFIYYSIKSEVDTKSIINRLLAQNKTVTLPRIKNSNSEMFLHKINSLNDLSNNGLSFLQPDKNLPVIPAKDIEIAVIPGIAFDKLKWRLGWGGGYYDKFLSESHSFSIGLSFDLQVVDELPTELHDQQLDLIITETLLIS